MIRNESILYTVAVKQMPNQYHDISQYYDWKEGTDK